MKGIHEVVYLLLIFVETLSWTNPKVILADANVTCIIQEDCILPCTFKPTGTVVIHWYKQQIPVHSYYYNKDQFGLQNKHFSGRTCLFNSHIPDGNASLLLRRVKIQDRGRYKCYTSTRKRNQEMFINLEVKALIQSVTMRRTEEWVTCSSHNVYPIPLVSWATHPASARDALENSTIKTTDQKGLFTVEAMLRIVGNSSNYTYFCSFTSADKTQVWTASWTDQVDITQDEGHTLVIPCLAPQVIQNFSLTWSLCHAEEPILFLKYDNRTKHTMNLWEDQARLNEDLASLGDGSLQLLNPDSEEHSGTYICVFSGSHSRHTVQTKVNITAASFSRDRQRARRSWWGTAASAAFVLFIIMAALPQCARQKDLQNSRALHRPNGTGLTDGSLPLIKDLNPPADAEISKHLEELQARNEVNSMLPAARTCNGSLAPCCEAEQEERSSDTPKHPSQGPTAKIEKD